MSEIIGYTLSQTPVQLQQSRYGCPGGVINQKLITFGGFSKIYHGDTQIATITDKLTIQQKVGPTPRRGHTIASNGVNLYLFGGDSQGSCMNDFWIYSNQWQQLKTTNTPCARYGHSSVIYNNKLYIYGGKNPTTKSLLDDFCVLDLDTLTWSYIQCNENPCGRYGHSLLQLDNKLYLFGGTTSAGRVSDLWQFDLSQQEFKKIFDGYSSDYPCGRSEAACMSVGSSIIVFGGFDGKSALSDIWQIDLHQNTAYQLGETDARYGAGAAHFKVENMGQFGPEQLGDINFAVVPSGSLYEVVRFEHLIFCGQNGKQQFSDVLLLQLYQLKEVKKILRNQGNETAVKIELEIQPEKMQVVEKQQIGNYNLKVEDQITNSFDQTNLAHQQTDSFQNQVIQICESFKEKINKLELQINSQQTIISNQNKTIQELDGALNQFINQSKPVEQDLIIQYLRSENEQMKIKLSQFQAGQNDSQRRITRLEEQIKVLICNEVEEEKVDLDDLETL
ncbi:Kelch_repeat-containing protein [Hexamita inflata]|uniref:Kelch_repeat-containing protein n=1 Tax=Hexamita inflata TaxID=28002 RepID=A0ABP1H4N3_9EUKA